MHTHAQYQVTGVIPDFPEKVIIQCDVCGGVIYGGGTETNSNISRLK